MIIYVLYVNALKNATAANISDIVGKSIINPPNYLSFFILDFY